MARLHAQFYIGKKTTIELVCRVVSGFDFFMLNLGMQQKVTMDVSIYEKTRGIPKDLKTYKKKKQVKISSVHTLA